MRLLSTPIAPSEAGRRNTLTPISKQLVGAKFPEITGKPPSPVRVRRYRTQFRQTANDSSQIDAVGTWHRLSHPTIYRLSKLRRGWGSRGGGCSRRSLMIGATQRHSCSTTIT